MENEPEIIVPRGTVDLFDKRELIQAQIKALEAQQLRPMRELALGDASAGIRLRNIDDNIGLLRRQLAGV